jgi:hypothetical protein
VFDDRRASREKCRRGREQEADSALLRFVSNSEQRRSSGDSSGPNISMMQPADSGRGKNPAVHRGARFHRTSSGRSFAQRKMRSVFMVVADVLTHETFQMTLIENNHMIEQVPAAVANPAFCNIVLPRTSETGPFRPNTQGLDGTDHLLIEVRGPVENQILRRSVIGECFPQLLHDPGAARMASDFPMQNSPVDHAQ